MSDVVSDNPTTTIPLNFGAFLEERRSELAEHTAAGGITDYAFGFDHSLRKRIASVAPARYLVSMLSATAGPILRHLHRLEMVAVGPRQFPEIHSSGAACARRLGIGIPQIFIAPAKDLAAYTFATDDTAPTLVLSGGLIEVLEPAQLQFVIGHECGHIHNLHGAYNTAVQNLTNPLAKLIFDKMVGLGVAMELVKSVSHTRMLATAITGALKMFFLHWSRAAEVTCDRAGLICCGDLESAQRTLATIATGGVTALRGLNIDEYLRQLEQTRKSPVKLLELFESHPLIPKRIEALRLFAESEVFCAWRPELRRAPRVLDKGQLDAMCGRAIGILGPGNAAGGTAA
ncbi:MAG TPA: M48 family metallopeptidase [Candidatus Acidoferrales bacterium]|nr:M48 family metallopeptidase [Candidatus Acidoferrales bacterium]